MHWFMVELMLRKTAKYWAVYLFKCVVFCVLQPSNVNIFIFFLLLVQLK